MKKLYNSYFTTEVLISKNNKTELLKNEYNSKLRYNDTFNNKSKNKEITNWEDLKKECGNNYVYADYLDKRGNKCSKKIFKENFISMKKIYNDKEVELKNITLNQVLTNLSSDECMDLFKDYGMFDRKEQK